MQEKNHRRRIIAGVFGAAVILLLADQFTKNLVVSQLKGRAPLTLIPGLLELTYVENTGAAFGILKGNLWLVYALSAVAYAAIVAALFRYRSHSFFTYAASAMLLAGGIGNLMDRQRYGFVVDFIHALFFDYVFNFADCCITVACVFLILHVLLLTYREKKQAGEGGAS